MTEKMILLNYHLHLQVLVADTIEHPGISWGRQKIMCANAHYDREPEVPFGTSPGHAYAVVTPLRKAAAY